jgi:signal transduction histidine kinase
VSIEGAATATRTRGRAAELRALAERVLEAPDLAALARCLTVELPRALGAPGASLLVWDRRLETFETVELLESGALHPAPALPDPKAPRPRWLVSDGQLLETRRGKDEGTLVPLLARNGLAGTVTLAPIPRRRRPMTAREARLVSLVAARAALALENHAYQRELIASERLAALGTMAGMLAHDFRGPMTVIRGYAETLAEDGALPAPDEVKERARLIVEAADRLERMTTETLDFARGAERLVLRPVPLGLFLAELAAGLEQELPGLTVARELGVPGGRRVPLDVDKIRRAVSNVAANARDAMGGRGRLTMRARLEPRDGQEWLVLDLEDAGPGVPPEIRDTLFEPFVTVGKKRGTGLGLAVARRFLSDHGGTIELVPPSNGRGACFRVSLPAPPAPRRPSADSPAR